MIRKDSGKIGHDPTGVLDAVSQRRTAYDSGSIQVIRDEVRSLLSLDRRGLLYRDLGPYIDNRQFTNLAVILDPIVCSLTDDTGKFRLCIFFEQISRDSFCHLFSEFSKEGRSRIVEWFLKAKKIPFTTDVLYHLLISAEDVPADGMKFKRAATQLIFSNLVHRLLNFYQMGEKKQEILAEVYYLNYEDAEEVDVFIDYLQRNYDECCTRRSPVEENSKRIFKGILERFKQIFKEKKARLLPNASTKP